MNNVFYFKNINSIGGVESFFYYLAKKYDFKIYYKTGDIEQIKRLAKYVEIHKYKEPIKCDRFFCNYGLDIEVEAKEKYHIVHCDYKNVWFSPILYDDFKYIGVSQLVCDSFKELTGKDIELIYNPISVEKKGISKFNDNKLHLISATRLTREKGLDKMIHLARLLDKARINYEWLIYTNKKKQIISSNVKYKDTKLDITEEIEKADYLVQLSECEAYCYSVVESLILGTPVITTDLPVFKELGLNDSNSIKYSDNMDVNKLLDKKTFKYDPPKDTWNKYLPTKKEYNPKEIIKAKVIRTYTDLELNKKLKYGDIIEITKERASYLENKELIEW